jgi:hypothetical protein
VGASPVAINRDERVAVKEYIVLTPKIRIIAKKRDFSKSSGRLRTVELFYISFSFVA